MKVSGQTIQKFISLESCERFLWYSFHEEKTKLLYSQLGISKEDQESEQLSFLLKSLGKQVEEDILQVIEENGELHKLKHLNDISTIVEYIDGCSFGKKLYLNEAPLKGDLGGIDCLGRPDLIEISKELDGTINILVSDIKSSRQDKVGHRLQVAFYCKLLEQMLYGECIQSFKIKGALIHRDEDGNIPDIVNSVTSIIDLDTFIFELEPFLITIDILLRSDDSTIQKITRKTYDSVNFNLDYKCDGCKFNRLCFTEASRSNTIDLIPKLNAVDKRTLITNGINHLSQIKLLKELKENSTHEASKNQVYLNKLENLEYVSETFVEDLFFQVDRILNRGTKKNRIDIEKSERLPSGEDVIRVYLDVQRDYIRDRIYMLGTLIKGPQLPEQKIVIITEQEPDDIKEEQLFIRWITALIDGIKKVTNESNGKIHFFTFDGSDQKAILEGVKRHISSISNISVFYDLITQTPIDQSMLTNLSYEINSLKIIPWLNQNLYRVSEHMGFNWIKGETNYKDLFKNLIFDDRLEYYENVNDSTSNKIHIVKQTIETRARFTSQIPLEYVYPAWGLLEKTNGFDYITKEHLLGFQNKRLDAIAFIEEKLRPKKSLIRKKDINLDFHNIDVKSDLETALISFLRIESHYKVQGLITKFNTPLLERVKSGKSLKVCCIEPQGAQNVKFNINYKEIGLNNPNSQFKPGDPVVVNVYNQDNESLGAQLIHGQIGYIRNINGTSVTLNMSKSKPVSKDDPYRFNHEQIEFEEGKYYSLDEIADDFNAGKFEDMCLQSSKNYKVSFLKSDIKDSGLTSSFSLWSEADLEGFYEKVRNASKGLELSTQQKKVIGELKEPIFLVQGPPGTGKSYTIGWAIIARILSMNPNESRNVIVSGKTHNAVNIVLKSVAEKVKKLNSKDLNNLDIYKFGSNTGDLPKEIIEVPNDRTNYLNEIERIKNGKLTVVGATPAAIYNLLNKGNTLGNVLVIDEASQMTLPEALTVTSFIKSGGQLIVVGDHRQMPPYYSYDWRKDLRRETEKFKPFYSVFEYLKSNGVKIFGLDRSFRIPKVIAEFLNKNIYIHDGIDFYSEKTEEMPTISPKFFLPEFVKKTLDPKYPIVIVEYYNDDKQLYQKDNEFEEEYVRGLSEILQKYLKEPNTTRAIDLGIVVPHRAQKVLFANNVKDEINVDTVERYQGDEKDIIFISATVSDLEQLKNEAEFFFDVRRLNVAMSRTKLKLIIFASSNVFQYISNDLDNFLEASLWKLLRYSFCNENIFDDKEKGIRIYGKRAD